ncbi:MAG: hypothetical protein IKO19_03800 [Candidatus Riflebacteria bacterium]|nr:hypothetical protein [Candidatus Riflebacteria bacterium]
MLTIKKKALTLVEILICFAILSGILGIIIVMMSRGATNVKRGSFNALAANQAFWIVSVIRSDISRSNGNISVELDGENTWNGDTEFKVTLEGGTASYSLEKKGDKKIFVRKFVASNAGTAFVVSDNKKQTFGDEFLKEMTIKLNEDNSYLISITMDDTSKSSSGIHDFTWTSSIYPPETNGLNEFWVSTLEN